MRSPPAGPPGPIRGDGPVDPVAPDLVPLGTPIDLDNCAREPIHIPGSVQPRGVLIVAREPELVISQVSANVEAVFGVGVDELLGQPLDRLLGPAAARVRRATATFGDLRERNPLELEIDVDGTSVGFDLILHRVPGGILLLELEAAFGPRPFSFPNTYQAVRGAVTELNRAASLDELYRITAEAVRDLTGFDRVMVYRYDREYNGEVVAEAKREDLNSFLGLHYPASDIPAQARALYEQNWIRLISDAAYVPSPLVPAFDPVTDEPIDLTHATLRSVSPIHLEYLQNMGVRASMSISLLRDGKLWGLIACHHYAGPHLPPYGTRAAAEFLGSTLSLRLVDRHVDDELHDRLAAQAVLAKLTAATFDDRKPLLDGLLGQPDLLDLIAAEGVAVSAQQRYDTRGRVPTEDDVRTVAAWAASMGEEVVDTDCLANALPHLDLAVDVAAGVLAITLPDGQFAVWFRAEALRSVDWGGDPTNKALAVREGDEIRMSPRKSFERWRETIRGRSTPWTGGEIDAAGQLRRHLVEAMYQRTRGELRTAEMLQRSLLPDALPVLPGWDVSAHYEPAAGGRVGGDWYDAFRRRDGRLVVVLGDVAGHGLEAAGTMAQLRNGLRAHLFDGLAPEEALDRINRFSTNLLPGAFATAAVACVELGSGRVRAASAGHPMPFVVTPRAAGVAAQPAPIQVSPPLGVTDVDYVASEFTLPCGAGLVFFSDGLIERRDEGIDTGLDALAGALTQLGPVDAHAIWAQAARGDVADDVTVLALRRAT